MRLKITNASRAEDSFILPLIRYAATHFSIPGRVSVTFRATRNGRLWGGYCTYGSNTIVVRSLLDEASCRLPCEMKTLGYFRSSNIPITPYIVHSPAEIIVHVAAHEMAHCMRAGQKFRKSRIEVFCENRATEVLEAFRSIEGQAWVAAERERMTRQPEPKIEPTPNERMSMEMGAIESKLKRWNTKAKRAATAIKKLERRQRFLEKKITASPPAMVQMG